MSELASALCTIAVILCLIGALGYGMWMLTMAGMVNGGAALCGALVLDAVGFFVMGVLLVWLFDEGLA